MFADSASLVQFLLVYKYLFLFPLAIVEGPLLMLACGFLWRLGIMGFWPAFTLLLTGDFVADILWYTVGRFGARTLVFRFGKYIGITEDSVHTLTRLFRRHKAKILLISKMTAGFGFSLATLTVAGMVRIDLKKYALYNAIGGVYWTAFLLVVGYWFGHAYATLERGARIAFFILGITLLMSGLIVVSRLSRRQVLKENDRV